MISFPYIVALAKLFSPVPVLSSFLRGLSIELDWHQGSVEHASYAGLKRLGKHKINTWRKAA